MKKKYKVIVAFILGLLTTIIGVYAKTIFSGNSVSYDNSKSNTSATNIEDALKELYKKADSCNSTNENILVGYTYNQTSGSSNYCITGEEATCQKTNCYKNKSVGACPAGTIIRYKVNDSSNVWFYVLHDDGDKITMQQRKNTVTSRWGSGDYNTNGPRAALQALESATSSWTNVENQTYKMGTTNFNGTNSYTGCLKYNECTKNQYTLGYRQTKARMITVQEAVSLGCTRLNYSCPIGIANPAYVTNDSKTYAYWTMTAYSGYAGDAWYIDNRQAYAGQSDVYREYGIRAVVVIFKQG